MTLAMSTTIDAGLEIVVVSALLALLAALLGVPRWSAPRCRRCGAAVTTVLLPPTGDGATRSVPCACGNAVDRRGGVRWRGTRRVRWLLLLALLVGGAAAGARAWSYQRAVEGLIWRDLLPTESVVRVIEADFARRTSAINREVDRGGEVDRGAAQTPWWLEPGHEFAEFDRRVRLGIASDEQIRRVLLSSTGAAPGPGSREGRLAMRVLGHGPASARPLAAALAMYAPRLDSPHLAESKAFLFDRGLDRALDRGLEMATWPTAWGGRASQSLGSGRGIFVAIGGASPYFAVPGLESSRSLGFLVQIFAIRRVSVGSRDLFDGDASRRDPTLRIFASSIDGTSTDPAMVFVPGAALRTLHLSGDGLDGQRLEVELLVASVDRMTAEAIGRAGWTARELASPRSGVQSWKVVLSATIDSVHPAPAAGAGGGAPP